MSDPRILVLDIERIPIQFSGDAWSLNDMKGRRIPVDWVTRWSRTICFAYRWYGQKKISFHAEWDEGGNKGMHQAAWDLYNDADVVVGHNIQNFDTKKLQGGWIEHGLGEPSPVKHFDTLLVARRKLGFDANHLDTLTQRFGLRNKTDKYSVQLAESAVAGDVKAQRRLRSYNVGDIDASTDLFEYLRPIGNLNFAAFSDDDERRCRACAGTNVQRRGYAVKLKGKYPRYACMDCGSWSTGSKAVHMAELS